MYMLTDMEIALRQTGVTGHVFGALLTVLPATASCLFVRVWGNRINVQIVMAILTPLVAGVSVPPLERVCETLYRASFVFNCRSSTWVGWSFVVASCYVAGVASLFMKRRTYGVGILVTTTL